MRYLYEVKRDDRCEKCGDEVTGERHACPYCVLQHGDDPAVPVCNCCAACENECAQGNGA